VPFLVSSRCLHCLLVWSSVFEVSIKVSAPRTPPLPPPAWRARTLEVAQSHRVGGNCRLFVDMCLFLFVLLSVSIWCLAVHPTQCNSPSLCIRLQRLQLRILTRRMSAPAVPGVGLGGPAAKLLKRSVPSSGLLAQPPRGLLVAAATTGERKIGWHVHCV
jgi:hypothetical protein